MRRRRLVLLGVVLAAAAVPAPAVAQGTADLASGGGQFVPAPDSPPPQANDLSDTTLTFTAEELPDGSFDGQVRRVSGGGARPSVFFGEVACVEAEDSLLGGEATIVARSVDRPNPGDDLRTFEKFTVVDHGPFVPEDVFYAQFGTNNPGCDNPLAAPHWFLQGDVEIQDGDAL